MAQKTEYRCLRDAFCARHRCASEAFTRKVFWRTLHRHALIPALLIGGAGNHRFEVDLECIANLGDARSMTEFDHGLDELVGRQEVDRSRLRRYLSVRVSILRLRWLLEPYMDLVQPPAEAAEPKPARVPSGPAGPTAAPREAVVIPSPRLSAESGVQRMRQVLRVHGAVVVGTPLEEALANEGLDPAGFENLLASSSHLRPEAAWLLGYIRDRQELAQLRAQAARQDRLRAI